MTVKDDPGAGRTPYAVQLRPPDIADWCQSETGFEYFQSFDSGQPGPHVMVSSVVHGNEICGAIAVDRLLRDGLRPKAGWLTLGFANVEAYQRLDLERPDAFRFVDEDFNRVWSEEALDSDRDSVELRRARRLRPLMDSVDLLLDLHSMQHPCVPLMLAGPTDKGLSLAQQVGYPATVVCDAGHKAGRRLRDYARFSDPQSRKNALLVECGQHYEAAAAEVAMETTLRFLAVAGTIDSSLLADYGYRQQPAPQKVIRVTEAVTIDNEDFRFAEAYKGLEVIPRAGTVIAEDGGRPIRTPYDNCVLIMPTRRVRPGNTAVRLGRFLA